MCQLSFINLGNIPYNKLMAYLLAVQNTSISNKDGYGIYTAKGGLFKTEKSANNLIDIGDISRDVIIDGGPVLQHVRQATTVLARRVVSKENAHPFVKEKIVLAHNGSMEYRVVADEARWKEKTGVIDSEMFAQELDELYTGDIVKDLNNTYKKFYGKFAFLIHDKAKRKFYAARGSTAKLHLTYVYKMTKIEANTANPDPKTPQYTIDVLGYIINTDSSDLSVALCKFVNIVKIIYNVDIDYDEPKELEKESIFELDKSMPKKIGDITEVTKPVPVTTTVNNWQRDRAGGTQYPLAQNTSTYTRGDAGIDPTIRRIVNQLRTLGLRPTDLDDICVLTFGEGICYLTDKRATYLADTVLPLLKKRTHPKFVRLWNQMCKVIYPASKIYADYNLQFPYMMNEYKEIQRVGKLIQDQVGETFL